MPLNRHNVRTFHRTLYAGILETVTLLKRNDDQGQGTVTKYQVFQVRRSLITRVGEPIQGDIDTDVRTTFHLPRIELDRIGVGHINAADRIIDFDNRYWQPESADAIIVKLFEQHVCVDCVRIDPPGNQIKRF